MAETGLDIQHGLLSFANPNYNLASPDVNSNNSEPTEDEDDEEDDEEEALLREEDDDEAINSDDHYQALYEELDAVCHFSRSTGIPHSNTTPGGRHGGLGGLDEIGKVKTRRSYAQLDLGSMGVDVDGGGREHHQHYLQQQQSPVVSLRGGEITNTTTTTTTTTSIGEDGCFVGGNVIPPADQLPVSPYQSLVEPDLENNIQSEISNNNRGMAFDNNRMVYRQSKQKKKMSENCPDSLLGGGGGTPASGEGDVTLSLESMGRKSNSFLDYYLSLETAISEREKQLVGATTEPVVMETEDDLSLSNERSKHSDRKSDMDFDLENGPIIAHIQGDLTNELYAVPVKRRVRKAADGAPSRTNVSPLWQVNAPSSPLLQPKNGQTLLQCHHRPDETRDAGDGAEMVGQLEGEAKEKNLEDDDEEEELLLPPGWERHQDDDGPYYWHISSGTIQREPPTSVCPSQKSQSKRLSHDLDVICNFTNFTNSSKSSSSVCSSSSSSNSGGNPATTTINSSPLTTTKTVNSSGVEIRSFNHHHRRPREEMQMKRRSYPQAICSLTSDQKPIRFAVRSLGWVEIAEDDLTPERSSKAVNKCIVDLSLGRNDILDVVGRWGDGKDLFMDLDDYCLRLTDPQDLTVLNTQPIHTIRVWGVGRDNGRERDFAYVARDRLSRKHMCHVFRCDNPARIIANTLRDICKKIMIERSLQQNLAKQVLPGSSQSTSSSTSGSRGGDLNSRKEMDGGGLSSAGGHHHNHHRRGGATRPTDLPTEQRRLMHRSSSSSGGKNGYEGKSFPTPMEEPKKLLKAQYLGSTKVDRPVGMEILNIAIDRLSSAIPKTDYKYVNVAVAPSTITVIEPGEDGKVLAECRVRFLSFLGIGRNVKSCAFIMHTAHEQYIAHVFTCEPSSGALCKTIEAACKLRYQKCLDAHRLIQERKEAEAQNNKGLSSTLRNVLGNLTTRLTNNKSGVETT